CFPVILRLGLEPITQKRAPWLLLPRRNIFLDTLARQVEPEDAESERTPLSPRHKDWINQE
ncbi:MAG: hypothetical protein ACK5PS_06825, partial [Desulfopila sp.]